MERRTPSKSRVLSPYRACELLIGRCEFLDVGDYDGYATDGKGGDLSAYISEEMRLDWVANRRELLKVWRSGMPCPESFEVLAVWPPWLFFKHDGEPLPWAARQFGGS